MPDRHGPTVGRLAPSPTGGLHLGHARTFLAAWLLARGAAGRVIFRMEDLDASRVRPEAMQGAIDDLRWLGLDWDEGPDLGGPTGPYVQSRRLAEYERVLDRLRSTERVYPCTCTRAEIARAASAPHAEDEGPTYPGTCSGRPASASATLDRTGFAWRFRVAPGPVGWNDLFQGHLALDPAAVGGDFLVARDGAGPAYQLAVVTDDAAMGVTQVVRGMDLIPSTPRQILLNQALGFAVPAFGHVPLVYGPDGRRLAKRDGSIKLAALRQAGVDPTAFVGWLAWSLGLSEAVEPRPPRAWVGRFDLARVAKAPLVLTPADLDALHAGRVPGGA